MINRLLTIDVFNYWLRKMYDICIPTCAYGGLSNIVALLSSQGNLAMSHTVA